MKSATKLLITLAILICCSAVATGATLQAKVVEVQTGNTLVVSNINRSVRVRLKSVMPPEPGQRFSEAARDHLKVLVFDKVVMIEYTHLADGYLKAKVYFNGIDIGSQMLRDGVAWYDRANDHELKDADRDLYAQCEQAARGEKRGLWHDESAMAPWEFRRIQQEKINRIATRSSDLQSQPAGRTKQAAPSNSDLMGALMGNRSANAAPSLRPIAENGSFDRWTSFESPSGHFSIMIPSNGVTGTKVSPDAMGVPVVIDFLSANSDRAFMVLIAARGPNENRNDPTVLDESIKGLIMGWNQAAAKRGGTFSLKPVRDIRLAGYVGRQFSVVSDLFSGTARAFTKQIGEARQVFVLFAVTRPGSEALGSQFLNSFKITE